MNKLIRCNRTRLSNRRHHWLRKYKVAKGCENCGYNKHFISLDFAHLNTSDKHPATFSGSRSGGMAKLVQRVYKDKKKTQEGLTVLMQEVRKCKVLCKNCHAVETFENKELQKTWEIHKKRTQNVKEIQTLEKFL